VDRRLELEWKIPRVNHEQLSGCQLSCLALSKINDVQATDVNDERPGHHT